jgi:hypothetical protein
MPKYLLAKHVYFCLHGNYVVFLDLRGDKYFALETQIANEALRDVQGWQALNVDPDANAPPKAQSDPEKTTQSLLDKGLLTRDPKKGKEAVATSVEAAEQQLVTDPSEDSSAFRAVDMVRLLAATAATWTALRLMSLERVVMRVQRRKERLSADGRIVDLSAAKKYVALYERMRPFVFGARDACLFESLVQLEYLARYGLYPTWVFGVRTAPFGAHCWVQYDGVVFNDTVGHVRGFTPIMAI